MMNHFQMQLQDHGQVKRHFPIMLTSVLLLFIIIFAQAFRLDQLWEFHVSNQRRHLF
jgi:hypothetical protein